MSYIHGINIGLKKDHRCVPRIEENGESMPVNMDKYTNSEGKLMANKELYERAAQQADANYNPARIEEIMSRANHEPTKEEQISEMLRERGSRYGNYENHAIITQNMMKAITVNPNYHRMPQHMQETLHMICHKIGRIVNGDPNYLDSWIDIIGYTQLTVNILEEQQKGTAATKF